MAIACIIDVSRLFVYSSRFTAEFTQETVALLVTAIIAGFSGAFIGKKLLKKVTLHFEQTLVAIMFFGVAIGLAVSFSVNQNPKARKPLTISFAFLYIWVILTYFQTTVYQNQG